MSKHDIYIVGVQMTAFGRHLDRSLKGLTSPISEGAAAAILCTGAAIDKCGFDRRRAIKVHASGPPRSVSPRAWTSI